MPDPFRPNPLPSMNRKISGKAKALQTGLAGPMKRVLAPAGDAPEPKTPHRPSPAPSKARGVAGGFMTDLPGRKVGPKAGTPGAAVVSRVREAQMLRVASKGKLSEKAKTLRTSSSMAKGPKPKRRPTSRGARGRRPGGLVG